MQGPACDVGNAVIAPMIQRRKEKCNTDLADFTAANAPKQPSKLLSLFFKPPQAEKDIQLKGARLQAQAGNPMMDFDLLAGEALLAEMKQQLEEKGLKLKSETRKSNGELDEQILLFA